LWNNQATLIYTSSPVIGIHGKVFYSYPVGI
jgi:hypothetical protein